jgi:rhodanese-related sulfurtransferase
MVQLHRRWRELPIDRPLILVDNRGFRSLLAAGYLAARGYSVERLFGGMSAWKAATAPGKDKRP